MNEYYCIRCNKSFDDNIDRFMHQSGCDSTLFLHKPIQKTELNRRVCTYEEILLGATNKYPQYRKYVGRRNPSEPNNMSFLYLGNKGKHEERSSKNVDV